MFVPVETSVLHEPRIKRLALRLKMTVYDVIGRLVFVWALPYERVDSNGWIEVDDVDGAAEREGFAAGMIYCRLAESSDDYPGLVRICGTSERLDKIQSHRERGRLGGQASAANRPKLPKSKLTLNQQLQQKLNLESSDSLTSRVEERKEEKTQEAISREITGLPEPEVSVFSPSAQSAEPDEPDLTRPPVSAVDASIAPVRTAPPSAHEKTRLAKTVTPPEVPVEAETIARMLLDFQLGRDLRNSINRMTDIQREALIMEWSAVVMQMNIRDSLQYSEIQAMAIWAMHHEFWSSVIRDTKRLRKHWDEMAHQRRTRSKLTPERESAIREQDNEAHKKANLRRKQKDQEDDAARKAADEQAVRDRPDVEAMLANLLNSRGEKQGSNKVDRGSNSVDLLDPVRSGEDELGGQGSECVKSDTRGTTEVEDEGEAREPDPDEQPHAIDEAPAGAEG